MTAPTQESSSTGASTGAETAPGASGDTPTSSTAGNGQDGDPNKKIAALEEEKDRHYQKRSEAEKRLADAESKLKEIEDKDKSELEKATGKAAELEEQNAKLQKELDDLRLDNAVLADSKHSWRDRRAVLRLLDREGIEFKDGKISGLDKALDALAKESPYLIDDSPKEPADPGKGQPASGKAPAAPKGNVADKTREQLAKKYPGLRRE